MGGRETSSLFDFQSSILDKEIEYIHQQIAHFDTLSFQIKGWAITIWAAVVAFGAQSDAPIVVFAAAPAMLTFWVLDAFFKQYQRRVRRRMAAIESFLDSTGSFAGAGLREAFAVRDFGNFPIHDPVSRRSAKLYKDLEVKRRTAYWRAFIVGNLLYFYLLLIGSSVLIGLLVMVNEKTDAPPSIVVPVH